MNERTLAKGWTRVTIKNVDNGEFVVDETGMKVCHISHAPPEAFEPEVERRCGTCGHEKDGIDGICVPCNIARLLPQWEPKKPAPSVVSEQGCGNCRNSAHLFSDRCLACTSENGHPKWKPKEPAQPPCFGKAEANAGRICLGCPSLDACAEAGATVVGARAGEPAPAPEPARRGCATCGRSRDTCTGCIPPIYKDWIPKPAPSHAPPEPDRRCETCKRGPSGSPRCLRVPCHGPQSSRGASFWLPVSATTFGPEAKFLAGEVTPLGRIVDRLWLPMFGSHDVDGAGGHYVYEVHGGRGRRWVREADITASAPTPAPPEPKYAVWQWVRPCGLGAPARVKKVLSEPERATWYLLETPGGVVRGWMCETQLEPCAPLLTERKKHLYLGQKVRVCKVPVSCDGEPYSPDYPLAGTVGEIEQLTATSRGPIAEISGTRGGIRVWNLDPVEDDS